MATHSAAIAAWIEALSPGAFFKLAELPAPNAGVASTVMHRLLDDDAPIAERLAPGFFWRLYDDGRKPIYRCRMMTAFAHAGPGSGLAGYSAVNEIAWTTQIPIPTQVCVLGRRLTPIDVCITYRTRYNTNRARLTWAEVTMIEAVMHFDRMTELTWDEAMLKVDAEIHIGRLGDGAIIRRGPLREVAHTELRQPDEFHERIDDLCGHLPDVRTCRDYIWERHPDIAVKRGLPVPAWMQDKELARA